MHLALKILIELTVYFNSFCVISLSEFICLFVYNMPNKNVLSTYQYSIVITCTVLSKYRMLYDFFSRPILLTRIVQKNKNTSKLLMQSQTVMNCPAMSPNYFKHFCRKCMSAIARSLLFTFLPLFLALCTKLLISPAFGVHSRQL